MERFRQQYGIALTKKKLQEIILMLMAWEAVFAFSYLGYIELPAISTTTLHILVIVAAMMLGAQGSVPVVCVFAVTSMWNGTYSLSQLDRIFSPFASGMSLGSIMLAFARVLFAAGAGWLFDLYFRKPRRYVYLGIAGIAVASTFLHGLCVFAALYCSFPMLRHPLGSDSEVGEKQIIAAMRLSSGNGRVRKPEAADLFRNRCGSGGHSVHPVSAKGHLQGAVPTRHRCQRKPAPKYHRLFAASAGGSVGALWCCQRSDPMDCGGLVRDEGGDIEYFLRVRLCRRPSGFFCGAACPGSGSGHVCPETGILPGKETVFRHTRP